jgi:peroxiredoxin/DNA-binding transcriptional MerR regulator
VRIGDVARRAGVSTKAIRRYEALGLLAPPRLANGYRSFTEHDVRVVRELRSLRELGIPAERTRPFLDCLASGAPEPDDCPSSMAEYRTAIAELDTRIAQLSSRRAELKSRLTSAAYRTSCAPRPGTPPAVPPPGRAAPGTGGSAGDLRRVLRGRALPPLVLGATGGGSVDLRALGAGRTVLYVYPLTGRPDVDLPAGWDGIPGARGCTAEACGFRDHHRALADAGASGVYGISSQDTGYQEEVVRRLRLPFRMLSDPRRDLAAALGLPLFEAGGELLYTRLTMIVSGGVIEELFHPVTAPGEHAGQVLRWLEAAR